MSLSIFSREVGTLQDAIEYLHAHPHLFQREDLEKGHMQRVMAVLTQDNMEHLEKEFELYPRGLQLPTFIYLIKKLYIPDHEISKYFFVSDLIKFFQSIDINGDGHLQWSQFTEYIIENIRVVEKPKYKNKAFEENEIISTAYSKISSEYKMTKIYDLGCQSSIRKIHYSDEHDMYFLIENQTNCVRLFNRRFEQVDSIVLEGEFGVKKEINPALRLDSKNTARKSTIVDFSIDKTSGIIGCLFQDSLFFCNLSIKAGKTVNCESSASYKKYEKIQYLPQHGLWCLSSKTGQLHLFTVEYTSRTVISFKPQKQLHPHQNSVTQILQTSQPLCIATSSMDGNIKLYSNHLNKYYTFQHIADQTSSIINENKKKGILGISYTSQFGNYMLSFGFSNCLYIYCLDISITKGYVAKYTEHTGAIMWAKFLKGYPNVMSFDDKMNMRIWDFRKFVTIQFINCQKMFISPSRLELVPDLKEVLICEKKLTQFRAPILQKKSKQLNQFHDIFDIKFSPLTNQLYIFTSNDVRIYNYYTGCLKKLFTKLYSSSCQTNITACEFGFKCRRFFIGDAGGYVREFCSETGEELQDIGPGEESNYQNKEIRKIIFMKEHGILICCSLDGRTMIYERSEEGEFVIVRDLRECHEELLFAAVSERYCLLATAGDNGDILIWSLEKYILDALIVINSKPVGIAFSPIHPIMIVATEDGYLNFFYVKPYDGKQRYKCFTRVSINSPTSPLKHQILSFSCQLIVNAYLPKQCELTTPSPSPSPCPVAAPNHHLIAAMGTKSGKILNINLNRILQQYKIEQNHQIYIIKNCHRCETQNLKTVVINERSRVMAVTGFANEGVPVRYLDGLVHTWLDVCEGGVGNVVISKESSAIFCKSYDKKLRVYSFKNEYNGAINFSTFKKIFWRIPQVNFFKKLQSIDTTIYSIKLIQNKKFQAHEQTKIKVHLLLNQYLTNKQKQHYFNWFASKHTTPVVEPQPHKMIKSKIRRMDNANTECLSQVEFHQIYNKIKNSIQKSLETQTSVGGGVAKGKIFIDGVGGGAPKTKNRGQRQGEILTENTNRGDKDDFFEDFLKPRSKERSVIKQFGHSKLKAKSTIKIDPCFELFGHKLEAPRKKTATQRKNMLFTPLSTAKKIITSNFCGTFYR